MSSNNQGTKCCIELTCGNYKLTKSEWDDFSKLMDNLIFLRSIQFTFCQVIANILGRSNSFDDNNHLDLYVSDDVNQSCNGDKPRRYQFVWKSINEWSDRQRHDVVELISVFMTRICEFPISIKFIEQ